MFFFFFCGGCKFKFTCNNQSAVHTCAWHLKRIRVGAIVSVAANAVDGAFTGGAAVDGTLHTGFVSLSRLEKARWASLRKEKDMNEIQLQLLVFHTAQWMEMLTRIQYESMKTRKFYYLVCQMSEKVGTLFYKHTLWVYRVKSLNYLFIAINPKILTEQVSVKT